MKKRFLIALSLFSVLGILGSISYVRERKLDKAISYWKSGDYKGAIENFTPLAKLGDKQAQSFLGFVYAYSLDTPDQFDQSVYWLRWAAYGIFRYEGFQAAAKNIAVNFRTGSDGLAVNLPMAQRWCDLAKAEASGKPVEGC
jgi:TPR repeat protein